MKKKILVAEDSLTIQRVFELTFMGSDYQVTYVEKGEDLKNMAKELMPDLLICDGTLPDISGYALVTEMKNDPSAGKIPAILLIGSLEPFDEEKFKSSGADSFIFKPFESQELLEKVEEVLRDRVEDEEVAEEDEGVVREEGWDFTDVFEEVEMGIEDEASREPEDPFVSDLIKEQSPTELGTIEDFDVDLEELDVPVLHEDEPADEDEVELVAGTEQEDEETHPQKEIPGVDEILEDIEMDDLEDVERPIELGPQDEPDDILDSLDEPVDESKDLVTDEIVDEEDRMMEEGVRDVDDFPISAGYDFKSHKKLREAFPPQGKERRKMADEVEKRFEDSISSDEFREEIRGLISDVVEKVMWEAIPGVINDLKGDILKSIQDVVSTAVPEVAREIIQEELDRISKEIESES